MRIASIGISMAVLAVVAGCAQTTPSASAKWLVTQSKDPFTDSVTKMVTFGDFNSSTGVYTSSLKYYPFVGTVNGELVVGLRSGGRFRVPTGTVQFRVDESPAWTIEPGETPILLAPAQAISAVSTGDQKTDHAVAASQKQMMESVQKMMSPFTATGGEKAREIVAQMLKGKKFIYRTVGVNQAGSTTGYAEIDQSFIDGVRSLGVDVDPPAK